MRLCTPFYERKLTVNKRRQISAFCFPGGLEASRSTAASTLITEIQANTHSKRRSIEAKDFRCSGSATSIVSSPKIERNSRSRLKTAARHFQRTADSVPNWNVNSGRSVKPAYGKKNHIERKLLNNYALHSKFGQVHNKARDH